MCDENLMKIFEEAGIEVVQKQFEWYFIERGEIHYGMDVDGRQCVVQLQ